MAVVVDSLPLWIPVNGKSTREMESKENEIAPVWGALALILRVSRWFGTAPLRFVRRREGLAITGSLTMTIYGYSLLLVLNAFLITALITDFKVPSSKAVRMRTEISSFVWVVDYITVFLITSIGIFNAPMRMKRMIPYLNSVNEIITKLNNGCTLQLPEKKRCIILALYLLCSFVLIFFGFCVTVYDATVSDKEIKAAYMYGSYYIEYYINMLLELQFILIAVLAHEALKMINEGLVQLILSMDSNSKYKDSDFLPVAQTKKAQESIRRLVFAYSATCDVMRESTSVHGILLLLLLISILVHMVVTPYYFIYYLINPAVNLKNILLQLCWCFYHISKLVLIVEPGHRMQEEMARTQRLVGQLTNRVKSPHDPLFTEVDIFFRQIQLNKVKYSPLGMCVLTRPLIASIIGGVTTYLVIIVQFQSTSSW